MAPSAASVLMKILYLARCIRFDLLHPACMLAREITRWTVACDKRLHRLVSYMNTTKDLSLESFVGDQIADLSVVVYSDASFADCKKTSRSTTGCFVAIVGPNTFVPINALC